MILIGYRNCFIGDLIKKKKEKTDVKEMASKMIG